MTATIRYSTGNEHSPADPWGRSELAIEPGGRARLDHYFSRGRPARAWTGQVDPAALIALEAALHEAGFPAVPGPGLLPPDATVRRLAVEAGGAARQVSLGWHQAPSLAGPAGAAAAPGPLTRSGPVRSAARPRPAACGSRPGPRRGPARRRRPS